MSGLWLEFDSSIKLQMSHFFSFGQFSEKLLFKSRRLTVIINVALFVFVRCGSDFYRLLDDRWQDHANVLKLVCEPLKFWGWFGERGGSTLLKQYDKAKQVFDDGQAVVLFIMMPNNELLFWWIFWLKVNNSNWILFLYQVNIFVTLLWSCYLRFNTSNSHVRWKYCCGPQVHLTQLPWSVY